MRFGSLRLTTEAKTIDFSEAVKSEV